jgi:hypothetical protein
MQVDIQMKVMSVCIVQQLGSDGYRSSLTLEAGIADSSREFPSIIHLMVEILVAGVHIATIDLNHLIVTMMIMNTRKTLINMQIQMPCEATRP